MQGSRTSIAEHDVRPTPSYTTRPTREVGPILRLMSGTVEGYWPVAHVRDKTSVSRLAVSDSDRRC
jgi:hypothetical protein